MPSSALVLASRPPLRALLLALPCLAAGARAQEGILGGGATVAWRSEGRRAFGAELVATPTDLPFLWGACGVLLDSRDGPGAGVEGGLALPVVLSEPLIVPVAVSFGGDDEGAFFGASLPIVPVTPAIDRGIAPYLAPFVRWRPWRREPWTLGLGIKTTVRMPRLNVRM